MTKWQSANLETLRGKLTEISTYAIDDLRQPPLNGLTEAELISTTKPDAATKDKASFSSQLLQLLSATSSINSVGITGENWHAKQVSVDELLNRVITNSE
jgi:hypothetical protein